MPGKRVQFDDATWRALDLLARERMMDFQEPAERRFATCSASTTGRSTSKQPCGKAQAKMRTSPAASQRNAAADPNARCAGAWVYTIDTCSWCLCLPALMGHSRDLQTWTGPSGLWVSPRPTRSGAGISSCELVCLEYLYLIQIKSNRQAMRKQ